MENRIGYVSCNTGDYELLLSVRIHVGKLNGIHLNVIISYFISFIFIFYFYFVSDCNFVLLVIKWLYINIKVIFGS